MFGRWPDCSEGLPQRFAEASSLCRRVPYRCELRTKENFEGDVQ